MPYLVMRRIPWTEIQTQEGLLITVDPSFGESFSPIFETKEEAQRYYPDAKWMEITDRKEQADDEV